MSRWVERQMALRVLDYNLLDEVPLEYHEGCRERLEQVHARYRASLEAAGGCATLVGSVV